MNLFARAFQLLDRLRAPDTAEYIRRYLAKGREPWSPGYLEYRWQETARALGDEPLLAGVRAGRLPAGWGLRLDERIVEYPWLLAHLSEGSGRLLDAGSTFNFAPLVEQPALARRELTIFTLHPESEDYLARRISYQFGDLRALPFRGGWFDDVVCQSTLEHIGMDNAIYGDAPGAAAARESHLEAVRELLRVLKPGGRLFFTFPCGRYEDHGFFQQFDAAMIARVRALLAEVGTVQEDYFLYERSGWRFATGAECAEAQSFNPHTGVGRGADGAAHCRAICALRLQKTPAS